MKSKETTSEKELPLETDLLFVYGSLRPKYDHALNREFSACLGQGRTKGKMYRISWFPGVIFSKDSESDVVGDVVKIKDGRQLRHLDAFEGCGAYPPLYRRIKVQICLDDSKELVTCWAYEFARPIDDAQEIKSGDFLSGT
jgi:gamma-glutamylcyclotransferase (GGCT)/AIG2-like uncharacterized protein YtfP